VGGDHDDRRSRAAQVQLAHQFQARHARQLEVADDAGDLGAGAAPEERLGGLEHDRVHASGIQQRFNCFAHAVVILDHENFPPQARRHCAPPCSLMA